jgi:alpha-L-fucosidase
MRLLPLLTLAVLPALPAANDAHTVYIPDPSPAIQQRVSEWQDLKFGLLMHWGTYSQLGIVESWPVCPEDLGWAVPANVDDYNAFKTMYESLPYTFNPTRFDPKRWAAAARRAGMKYLVFTTKHHDGFCMYDSQYTDYKITDPRTPFSQNPQADVTRAIFDSFRAEGFWTGAYFSKPDWHSEHFWWPHFPAKDRFPNYDVEKYPQRWQNFVDFTHNQVLELCRNYGKIDILWFDGMWVAKNDVSGPAPSPIPGYNITKVPNLDIKMDELVTKVRQLQPEVIVVDREVPGKNQNYLTPENRVPTEMLPYPWESCIILGGGWSYSLNPDFRSERELVHMLCDIVAKGGNLLLNIGPGPDGTWYEAAYDRLEAIGRWMDRHSGAIYSTRAVAPYVFEQLRFTQEPSGAVNAIYLVKEGETRLPASIPLGGLTVPDRATVAVLGHPEIAVQLSADRTALVLPETSQALPALEPLAVVFRFAQP